MPGNAPHADPPVSSRLHPAVSKAIVGLAIWLALSIWWGFGGDGYADYLLTVVSGFLFIAMLLTFGLWRIWWRHPGTHGSATARGDREPLQAWLSGEFETWQGRLKGTDAAVEILLPIAAVAFGMTIFGILLHTMHGV